MLLDRLPGPFQRIAVQFAQRVEVQARNALGQLVTQLVARDPQTRARRTRVVDSRRDLGVTRVEAQAALDGRARSLNPRVEAFILGQRIEDDVIDRLEEFVELVVPIGRGAEMDLATDELAGQLGLK